MREVSNKILWVIGKLFRCIALMVLYTLKVVLGIFKLILLLFCLVARVFLVFVKAGTP